MKKFSLLAVFFVVMAAFTMAHAENKANAVSITPFAGGYFFDSDLDFKSSPVFGLRAGYNFTENVTFEGFFSGLRTEINALPNKPDHDVFGYGLETLYHFSPASVLCLLSRWVSAECITTIPNLINGISSPLITALE